MWRWSAYLSGVVLIAVALVAAPSAMIVESYVGGSAVDGYVEEGRYFVNPGHGRPIAEVSESTWRAVYWVERLWPFSVLVPGLIWQAPHDPKKQAITCSGCGAVMSSTHPLDPDDRPMRRP